MIGVTSTIVKNGTHVLRPPCVTEDGHKVPFHVTASIATESGGSPESLRDHLEQLLSDVHRQFPTVTFDVTVIDNSTSNRWDVV